MMTRQESHRHDSYLTLNWYDIQEMLAGHHPLTLLKHVLCHEAAFNPPTRLELGDQLTNADYLCNVLRDLGVYVSDLEPISGEICQLTKCLTIVVDSVVEDIVSLAAERGLCREPGLQKRAGVWRKKALSDQKMEPIKRNKPLAKGANYADPENKAFPLDTPERVKASHAYLHKYWNSGAKSGITATYNRDKFLDVHQRIITRMRRLGLEHNTVDSLDKATKRRMKCMAKNKAESLQKGGKRGTSARDGKNSLSPEMIDQVKIKRLKNLLSSAFSDHILFMKNYISACDERNDGLAANMDEAINENSRELLAIIEKYLPGYEPEEFIDRESIIKQFMEIWDEYIDSVKSLVVGGDTGNDSMARDGLRRLFLVKNKMVKYFVNILSEIAEEEELETILNSWVTHLQGYIESRDNDDFATSFQHLQDWQKAKEDLAKMLATWIFGRDQIDMSDMPKPKKLDLDAIEEAPIMGRTTNPPAPLAPAVKAANAVRREVNSPEGQKSVTASKGSNLPPVYGKAKILDSEPKRPTEVRETAIGHKPYCGDCLPDARNGKCYRKH